MAEPELDFGGGQKPEILKHVKFIPWPLIQGKVTTDNNFLLKPLVNI